MPAKWMIHLDDGKTLTDADCFPHEVEVLEKLGYTPENITSIERVISGRLLTIKKSPFIDKFFVATEEGQDVSMAGGPISPPIISKRIIGCHLLNSDPAIQCRLVMDPRNFNVTLKFIEVQKPTRKGINAKQINPEKGQLQAAWQKELIENIYTVIESPAIDSVHATPNGLAVILKNPKIRAELIIRNQNVLLGFTQKGQKLRIVEEPLSV